MTTMKKILSFLLLAVVATGCIEVDIYDTDHPTTGKLFFVPDWSSRTTGVDIPPAYTAELQGKKAVIDPAVAAYPDLLDLGTYTFSLYNTADKIAVDATRAVVTAEGAGVAAQPGCQFFGSTTCIVDKIDTDYTRPVAMRQLTRDLAFNLTIAEGKPERIASISARLDGIAASWNCADNTPDGAASFVAPLFTRNGDKLTAGVRLLGVVGSKQTLTIDLTFSDDRTQQIVCDITVQLATFNDEKIVPMILSGNVNTPIGSNVGGSITDWTVESGTIDLH